MKKEREGIDELRKEVENTFVTKKSLREFVEKKSSTAPRDGNAE